MNLTKTKKNSLATQGRSRKGGILAGLLACSLLAAPSAHAVKFRLPLSSDTTTHYYYDNDSTSGIKDWNCGSATYNGHRGTDFSGGPRGRAIFAGAVGTLDYKIDGFGDGYIGNTDGGGAGNYVRLAHASGYKSYYFHMNKGSVTTKAIGSSIACGEQIGGVGTSGNSSGLHLHFEVRLNGTADDPYSGPCGGPVSWWVNQGSGSPSTTCENAGVTVTVDNNTSGFSASANWITATSATDKYGADYRYRTTTATSDQATWTGNLSTGGNYSVQAWWSQGANRSASAPYIVYHSGGSTTVNQNQQANGGKWNALGTFNMAGGNNDVKLSCWTTTGFVVIGDAVRWVPQ